MTSDLLVVLESKTEIDDVLKGFFSEYSITKEPIPVSFRALIPTLRGPDRYTHLIHSYPAKLLMHIPYFFLNNTIFSKPGDTVLDPFCGTGTVLLEAVLANRNALGADANPLARLIAMVKTRSFDIDALQHSLSSVVHRAKSMTPSSEPDVVNINYWFNEKNKNALLVIRSAINEVDDENARQFFFTCFSSLVKKVSNADQRVSVPVKLNTGRYEQGSTNFLKVAKRLQELNDVDVFGKFEAICKENIARFSALDCQICGNEYLAHSSVIATDARHLTESLSSDAPLKNESIDLILTSPPYAGAQKYIRSSSLNLGWLDIAKASELRYYDGLNIGRENYTTSELNLQKTNIPDCDVLIDKISTINRKRAQIVCNYINEMKDAILESIRVLKHGGYFILVVGNNKVCGFEFNTQEYLSQFMQRRGLELVLKLIDDIRSYGLMTKRNKTADIISREWILVFKKIS